MAVAACAPCGSTATGHRAAGVITQVQTVDPPRHRTTVYRVLDRLDVFGVVEQVCGRVVEAPDRRGDLVEQTVGSCRRCATRVRRKRRVSSA